MKLIDHVILARLIEHKGLSYQRLADKVGCSKATIGHLATGHTSSTRSEWARAIERQLDMPSGSLFVAKLSRVSEDVA